MTEVAPVRALHAPDRQQLLARAVHRHRALTRDGLSERLFTLAFSGLVYPQIWEDPAVDLAAMELSGEHHVVTIASGGCNVMSYLAASPARITAVDLNRAHVALTRLKLAGIRRLPGHDDFYRFFGEADERANMQAFRRWIEPHLDAETARFWTGRSLHGRRRIGMFGRNIYRRGLLGRFIGAGHGLARLYGIDLRELLAARTLEQQRRFFDERIAPLFERRMVRWLAGRPASLFGLGIPPAQYAELAASGGGDIALVLKQRLERLACGFPLRENYFAWQAFNRAYAPAGSGPLPPYLQYANYAAIRAAAGRVEVKRMSFTEALAAMPPASADRYVLLDAQDWMRPDQLDALWSEIGRTARPGARVIFRTAGEASILPGRLSESLLCRWRYEAGRSRALTAADRSSIYGGFHLYVLKD
jgi:S-adenosylmethionine-diacylglycerol 3-amino-3-carboxypropyl transferase